MNELIHKRVTHRAKIIEGQFKGLQKQISDEVYCVDILTQSLAIQRSISSLNKLILENHLRTCTQEQFLSGDEQLKEKAILELLNVYELGIVRSK